jgi:cell division septum initiation protein DivIVA
MSNPNNNMNAYKQALEINRELKRKNDKLEEKIKKLIEIIEELVNAQETTDK